VWREKDLNSGLGVTLSVWREKDLNSGLGVTLSVYLEKRERFELGIGRDPFSVCGEERKI
jgi:hypothetical protein